MTHSGNEWPFPIEGKFGSQGTRQVGPASQVGSTPSLVFELHTQEIIVPPDNPALAHSPKIIERQLEIQWQDR